MRSYLSRVQTAYGFWATARSRKKHPGGVNCGRRGRRHDTLSIVRRARLARPYHRQGTYTRKAWSSLYRPPPLDEGWRRIVPSSRPPTPPSIIVLHCDTRDSLLHPQQAPLPPTRLLVPLYRPVPRAVRTRT